MHGQTDHPKNINQTGRQVWIDSENESVMTSIIKEESVPQIFLVVACAPHKFQMILYIICKPLLFLVFLDKNRRKIVLWPTK